MDEGWPPEVIRRGIGSQRMSSILSGKSIAPLLQ